MATSIPLNIITGRTGTAHVASDDDAAIWRGLVGSVDTVLYTGQQLALTENSAGRLTISNGVFCIAGGHMGRIADTETITYNLPMENNYRRTLVVIRYAYVSGMESMTLMTLQSDPLIDESPTPSSAASVASAIERAKMLTVETEPSTDYVLYDFVCNSDGIVDGTLQTKLTCSDSIPTLRAAISATNTLVNDCIENIENIENAVDTRKWVQLQITNNTVSGDYDLYVFNLEYSTHDEFSEQITVFFNKNGYNRSEYSIPVHYLNNFIFKMFRIDREFIDGKIHVSIRNSISINQDGFTVLPPSKYGTCTILRAYGTKV